MKGRVHDQRTIGIATGGCAMAELKQVTIYTDGACVGNPGSGGYAAILISGERRKEITGGRQLTTNNRMELIAAIVALEALKWPCKVTLRSDSRYLVDGGQQRRTQNWKVNRDLWDRLRDICEKHDVEFEWVKGHSGNPENERCDVLAGNAAREKNLPEDVGYRTRQPTEQRSLFDEIQAND